MSSFVPAGPAASGLRRAVGATVCATCGRANREDAAFCAGCGVRLASSCRSCGRALATDARFCDGCGAEAAGPSERPAPAPDPLASQNQATAWMERVARALASNDREAASSLAPTLVRRRRRLFSRSHAGVPGAAAELDAVLDGVLALDSERLATLGERQCLVSARLTGAGAAAERLYVCRVDGDGRTGVIESFAPVEARLAWTRLLELWADELPPAARDRASKLRAGLGRLGDPDDDGAAASGRYAEDVVLVDHRGTGVVVRGATPAAQAVHRVAVAARGGGATLEVLALTERTTLSVWRPAAGHAGAPGDWSALAVRFDAEGAYDRVELFADDDIEEAWRAFERLDAGVDDAPAPELPAPELPAAEPVGPAVPEVVEESVVSSVEEDALEALSSLYEDDDAPASADERVEAAVTQVVEESALSSVEEDALEAFSSLYEDDDAPGPVVERPASESAGRAVPEVVGESASSSVEEDALEALSSLYEDDDALAPAEQADAAVPERVGEPGVSSVEDAALETLSSLYEDDDLDPATDAPRSVGDDLDPELDAVELALLEVALDATAGDDLEIGAVGSLIELETPALESEDERPADDEVGGDVAVAHTAGPAPSIAWSVADNTAVVTMRAWSDRLLAGDSDAAILFLAPTHRSEDRRSERASPLLHPGVASASVLPVATRGDRVGLVQITVEEDDHVSVALHAVGLDARGRILDEITLDANDLEAAFDAVDEVLCSVRPDLIDRVAARRELTAALVSRDMHRARACFTAGAVLVQHDERSTDASLEGWLRRLAAVVDRCERLEVHVVEQLRSTVWGSVLRRVHRGRTIDGNDVESEAIVVLTTRDGLIERQETFSVDDRERALARFEELRPIRRIVSDALAAHNGRDLAGLRRSFAADATVTDRRHDAPWREAGVEELLDLVKGQWPVLNHRCEVEFERVIGDVTLVRLHAPDGAAPAGERAGSAWVICRVDGSAIVSFDMFEHGQRADAEARFIDVVGEQRVL